MINHGTYSVWLTGSKSYVKRCVYEEEKSGKQFIKFYGQLVEVKRSGEYSTVEEY